MTHELLVWDDGSTERSVDIACQYAKPDSRVRVVTVPHQARVIALHSCHAVASGEYIGWLDSDIGLLLLP